MLHIDFRCTRAECYINLEANPERYTGYGGFNATRIWMAIYKENCFSGPESECLEGRVFYRLISGFHASTTAHITEYFTSSSNEWQPNVDMFVWRLGLFPDRLKNIYFTFAFLIRYALS
jgi:ERO1-like protein beta